MARRTVLVGTLASAGLIVIGCAGGSALSPATSQAPLARPEGVGSSAATDDALACAPSQGGPVGYPGWQAGPQADASIVPLIASSQLTLGPSRFLFTLIDPDYRVLAAPDVATSVRFFALGRDAEAPTASAEGVYLDTGTGRGLYRASVGFDCWGDWGAEVEATGPDGATATARVTFTVLEEGTIPAVGQPAPRSHSLTADTPEGIARISTDPRPYPSAYAMTVAQAVTSGRPSLILFATPLFCRTGICGPTLEVVKGVAADYADRVNFVNVEPYELHETPNGLQPVLDANGNLTPVQAVLDYGLATEPYLFLVDAGGDVAASFEGTVGEDEVRAAIEDVLPD